LACPVNNKKLTSTKMKIIIIIKDNNIFITKNLSKKKPLSSQKRGLG
jgi:hypothetical protein